MNTPTVNQRVSAVNRDPLARRRRLTEQYAAANREAAEIIISDPEKYGHGSLLHQWAKRTLASTADQIYAVNRRGEVLLPSETGLQRGQLELLFDRTLNGGVSCPPL